MLPHSAARWSPAAGGGPEPADSEDPASTDARRTTETDATCPACSTRRRCYIYTCGFGNHRQWELQSLRDPSSYLQRFLLIFPTRIYPCFEQGRTRSWMPPTGEFSACFLAFGVGISFSISRRYSSFAFYSHGHHHPRLLEWPQWLPFRLGCLFHRFRTSFSDSLYWGNGRKYNENGSQMNIETN